MTLALDFSHTRLSLSRPVTSYSKVQHLVGALRRNGRWQINAAVLGKRFLDIGCGPNTNENFVNLDWEWRPGVDVVWDVTRGIPLPSGSLEGIFSEHCLEHLPLELTQGVLAEAHRLLRANGVIRVVVPSLELYLSGYAVDSCPFRSTDAVNGFYTPAVSLNRIMHAHGHQFIYDFQTLGGLLERAGFSEIRRCAFSEGHSILASRDTPGRAIESLYVEAAKTLP